jgi:hypothetical protein
MYGGAEGLNRIVFAARTLPEGYLWSVIFGQIAADDEAFEVVHAALCEPLPRGFAAVAYLDACNSRCREEKLAKHPFDTPEGHSMLRGWLTGDEESFAHSATGAVPFIASGVGGELLAVALGHANIAVRMEAAWASARLGDPNAVARLIGWCDRPETCWRAEECLRQLGFEDQIPDAAKTPEFRALSEMAQWLEHPSEFGRAPDELELADAREMYWPPTDDRRVVYAVRYLYRAADAGETDDAGYGMVGSVTFALFGEATAVLTPLQVYALHCCWELEMNEDRRAPAKRSVEAGMALLRKHNPQLDG